MGQQQGDRQGGRMLKVDLTELADAYEFGEELSLERGALLAAHEIEGGFSDRFIAVRYSPETRDIT